MKVLIASSSADLDPYRRVARDVASELGLEPLSAGSEGEGEPAPPEAVSRLVPRADLVLALVSWRPGRVAGPELGGDGRRSELQWQLEVAFRQGKPVLAFMAGKRWPRHLWEPDPEVRAWWSDFRGELRRLAVSLDYEPPVPADGGPLLPRFRSQVERELRRHLERSRSRGEGPREAPRLFLRQWPGPPPPERPYPVLLPYAHPDLFAGRERELAKLRYLLNVPIPVLGLYAASGAGKSSLLAAGLIPALRADEQPVAIDRHPHEPGLAGRLAGDLLTTGPPDEGAPEISDADPAAFIELLAEVRHLSGEVPILILDQFESVLPSALRSHDGRRHARAVVGLLLAASVQRQPGLPIPPCHWILVYRHEFHGEVVTWLGDVLREARQEGLVPADSLPHDVAGPERFHGWAPPPFGTARGAGDPLKETTAAFLAAIETPLLLRHEGAPRFPWRFRPGAAEALAEAFGRARLERPEAPLVPELQVVLASVLERAGDEGGGRRDVELPEDPASLIDNALEDHLRRALESAFPSARSAAASEGRARALLALRELADSSGRRHQGLPVATLARAIGPRGREIFEKLATPLTRLVLLERRGDTWCYALSHDRMAEVIVRWIETEGRSSPLQVDRELLSLRRLVALKTELYLAGEVGAATRLPAATYRRIEASRDALLWEDDQIEWWQACQDQRRAQVRLRSWRLLAGGLVLAVVFAAAWLGSSHVAKRRALFDQIAWGEPEVALDVLARLLADPRVDGGELYRRLAEREHPPDVLEKGLGAIPPAGRGEVALRVIELARPLLEPHRDDFAAYGALLWSLDRYAMSDPRLAADARQVRDDLLRPLRRQRPPPAPPEAGNPRWIDVPGGRFVMGSTTDAGDEETRAEHPSHGVTLDAFRMLAHEVSRQELRRLAPRHPGAAAGESPAALPAAGVDWYTAYTYAAWLGGRLPTEAEWEYAARAGCGFEICDRSAAPAPLAAVGWYRGNAPDPRACLQPVAQLEPNPWGFYDLLGNAWEWTADWFGAYAGEPQRNPWGPTRGTHRAMRGGGCWDAAGRLRPASRFGWEPDKPFPFLGFRVVLPPTPGESSTPGAREPGRPATPPESRP